MLKNYWQLRKEWLEGVQHITLDPEGPGVVRLHLIPAKPALLQANPAQLLINGTYLFPIGPSWSILLKAFMKAIEMYTRPGQSFTDEVKGQIDEAVFRQVKKIYPRVSHTMVTGDLQELLSQIFDISKGKAIPEELGGNAVMPLNSMTAPHRMDLIVSPMREGGQYMCPLDCAACYAKSGPIMDVDTQLDTGAWLDIIDQCRGAGIPMVTFTGGEPLMRPDLVELVDHAQWFVTRLNTSAVLLTPELAKALRKASLDGIQITLYSDKAHIHDMLVGVPGAFEKTVRGIQYALDAGLEVSINTPLVMANSDYNSTIDFVYKMGVCHLTCSSLLPVGGAISQIHRGEALTPEDLEKLLISAIQRCKAHNINLSFTSPGWLPQERILAIGLPSAPVCGACASNMAVAPNGQVVPCQSWLDGLTLGDMRSIPWKRIWNHPTAKRMRKQTALRPNCALGEDPLND